MRAGIRFYQAQAQLSATFDGWQSSRQVPTMIVGAVDESSAVRMVSDMAWGMSVSGYYDRTTYATVVEVINGDNGDTIPIGKVRWVRVSYDAPSIHTICADTYAELTSN